MLKNKKMLLKEFPKSKLVTNQEMDSVIGGLIVIEGSRFLGITFDSGGAPIYHYQTYYYEFYEQSDIGGGNEPTDYYSYGGGGSESVESFSEATIANYLNTHGDFLQLPQSLRAAVLASPVVALDLMKMLKDGGRINLADNWGQWVEGDSLNPDAITLSKGLLSQADTDSHSLARAIVFLFHEIAHDAMEANQPDPHIMSKEEYARQKAIFEVKADEYALNGIGDLVQKNPQISPYLDASKFTYGVVATADVNAAKSGEDFRYSAAQLDALANQLLASGGLALAGYTDRSGDGQVTQIDKYYQIWEWNNPTTGSGGGGSGTGGTGGGGGLRDDDGGPIQYEP